MAMRLNDPAKFCLVIPTFEGTPFLRRTLHYLKSIEFGGDVLLCDDSSGDHREFVSSAPESAPELSLEVHQYDHPTRFLDKLARSLERISAEYVLLCGQDDFVIPSGVEPLLEWLETSPDYVAARGRVARFRMKRSKTHEGALKLGIEFSRHAMLPYEQASAKDRVLSHIAAYTSTLYSIHRRRCLIESFCKTEAATKNVIFFQYLSSCITAKQGKIASTGDLFMARQAHGRSWAASLLGDNEHWRSS